MALESNSVGFMILIFAAVYLLQAIWIYKDCKKRNDGLVWIWCILSLISFPIVLIIYFIFSRYYSSENKQCTMGEKNCSNCGFKVDSSWNYCPNCNNNLGKSYASIGSNKGIVSAILIFIVGIATFATFLTYGIIGFKNSFQKVEAPGSNILYFKDKGSYTVFSENEGQEVNQSNYSQAKKLNVKLTEENTSSEVSIRNISGNTNYSFGDKSGKSFLQFYIDKPGNYELSTINNSADGERLTLSIAHEFIKRLLIIILGSIAILFGTISIGVFIILSTVKKGRNL